VKTDPNSIFKKRIEKAVQKSIQAELKGEYPTLAGMLTHHFGWGSKGIDAGKKIRPTLLLLTCDTLGGNWERALDAAVAIELMHNFSLIHDDIQDRSVVRHGRPSVWKIFGVAQGINAGDILFSLTFKVAGRLTRYFPIDKVLSVIALLAIAGTQLIGGQSLDLQFETERDVTLTEYWKMIEGKTAILFKVATQIGALLSPASSEDLGIFADYGRSLGMAFQVRDDWLGIWGNEAGMGKSVSSDLIDRKKTAPVIFGLQKKGRFSSDWGANRTTTLEIQRLARLLKEEGAMAYTEKVAEEWHKNSIKILSPILRKYPQAFRLLDFGNSLITRTK
jgi:geranylgeranyl diphosphate synthase type I